MPTISDNKNVWGDVYDWSNNGEEWSESFGSSSLQWSISLYPRIHNFLKKDGNILEIAPGFGRWTQYLKENCSKITVVDLNSNCIEFCKKKFAGEDKISYFVNDGKSLDMIKDDSLDFAFSFDSLVHVNQEVMESYLKQLSHKLKVGAYGFLHHSNLGMYKNQSNQYVDYPCVSWRDEAVDASFIREICQKYDLNCITQELVNWSGDLYTDCYTVIQRKAVESKSVPTRVFHNDMSVEQNYAKKISEYYCPNSKTEKDEKSIEIQNNIDALSQRFSGKKICFFGAGSFAKDLLPKLDLKKLEPICFFDSDKNKVGFEIAGIEVQHISEIVAIKPDVIIMAVEAPKVSLPSLKAEIEKNNLGIKLIDIQRIDDVL